MPGYDLLPTVTNNPIEPDKTRAEMVIDHYARPKPGSPCQGRRYPSRGPSIPAVGSLRGVPKIITPSYSEIGNENPIHDPDNYEITIPAEITPGMDVYLNGIYIAGAPEYRQLSTGKTKKIPQTERARFCRGVIWFLMNDETCLRDKLSEIGYKPPAKIPAPVPETIPATDICIENITGTLYPGPGAIPEDQEIDPVIAADIKEMKEDSRYREYDTLDQENNPEPPAEIIQAFFPVQKKAYPAGWINHLRITITEEAIPA